MIKMFKSDSSDGAKLRIAMHQIVAFELESRNQIAIYTIGNFSVKVRGTEQETLKTFSFLENYFEQAE